MKWKLIEQKGDRGKATIRVDLEFVSQQLVGQVDRKTVRI
jgi:hypothetical protein